MSRLPLVDMAAATQPVAELLAETKRRLGVVPNMFRAMANSPALLAGYLELSDTLSRGSLSAGDRERVALVVAQGNCCSYCLSAHTYLAEQVVGLSSDEVADARKAASTNPKTAAVLAFATAVNDGRGEVSDAQFAAARAAGLTDEELAETIAHVAVNVLTNYFNKAVDVDVDFPVIAV